uniref:Reverse transcriptase domain-containing protein n=1 Tax=Tanacetum cinerariifolium TaxID=118510 RepID=A0A6L2K5G8_TANCI|nr:reverse transcriptase domain-containing protein [Tanacetum cinerariifolium]
MVENSHFEENLTPVDTMTDNHTMAEMLRAPTEGCTEEIVVPPTLVEQFELKNSLINMMTSEKFFGLEKDNPHDHVRWFNKITSTIKYKDVPNSVIKLILFPFSLAGAARRWLEKEPPHSITIWDDLVSKFINELFPTSRTANLRNEISNFQQKFDESFHEAWERYKDLLRAYPHHGFTELHQLDTFYNALNPTDQDSLNAAAGGNLLEKSPQDALTIIENKSKQTSAVTTAMMAMLKQFQSNPPPAQVKAVEEICVTCGGAHPYYHCLAAGGNTFPEYRDNIQAKLTHAVNQQTSAVTTAMTAMLKQFQSNPPPAQVKAVKEICVTCGGNFNQGNPGYRPQGVANQMRPPDLLLKDLPEEDECVEETYTDPDHAEYNIKVPPPPPVQKPKPPIQRNFVLHTRDSLLPRIPYPSRMLKQKHQEKDDIQIQKFWNMFKQLHLNITLAEALVLMPKYQKMLKALLSNKEKLQELSNTPLNENGSAVILKKLPEKLGDPWKFLIPCGFSELKCKALADLGASINLMPLSKNMMASLLQMNTASTSGSGTLPGNSIANPKVNLKPLLLEMTLELVNRAICTPDGIARDVFVPVGKFTFPVDFVVVDYESDPRVPLILGRPFLRTARALINVHGEEMILREGDERLTLNMKHDTASYYNHPYRESEFADELALISYPLDYDDNRACDIESDIREIEFLLFQGEDSDFKDSIDQSVLTHCDDLFADPKPEMFLILFDFLVFCHDHVSFRLG